MARAGSEIVIEVTMVGPKQVEEALERMGIKFKRLSASTDKAARSASTFGATFRQVLAALGTYRIISAARRAMANFAGDVLDLAKKTEGLRIAFQNAAILIGFDWVQALNRMRAAVAGTISDIELLRLFQNAYAMGIVKSNQDLPKFIKLLQLSRYAARSLGQDFQYTAESLIIGISRLSFRLLDNLGITLRLNEVFRAYAQEVGKSAMELTSAEKQQALFNAVIQRGERIIAAAGDTATTAGEAMAQLSATVTNLKERLATLLLPAIRDVAGVLQEMVSDPIVIDWMQNMAFYVSLLARSFHALILVLQAMRPSIWGTEKWDALIESMRKLGDETSEFIKNWPPKPPGPTISRKPEDKPEEVLEKVRKEWSRGVRFGKAYWDMVKEGAEVWPYGERYFRRIELELKNQIEALEAAYAAWQKWAEGVQDAQDALIQYERELMEQTMFRPAPTVGQRGPMGPVPPGAWAASLIARREATRATVDALVRALMDIQEAWERGTQDLGLAIGEFMRELGVQFASVESWFTSIFMSEFQRVLAPLEQAIRDYLGPIVDILTPAIEALANAIYTLFPWAEEERRKREKVSREEERRRWEAERSLDRERDRQARYELIRREHEIMFARAADRAQRRQEAAERAYELRQQLDALRENTAGIELLNDNLDALAKVFESSIYDIELQRIAVERREREMAEMQKVWHKSVLEPGVNLGNMFDAELDARERWMRLQDEQLDEEGRAVYENLQNMWEQANALAQLIQATRLAGEDTSDLDAQFLELWNTIQEGQDQLEQLYGVDLPELVLPEDPPRGSQLEDIADILEQILNVTKSAWKPGVPPPATGRYAPPPEEQKYQLGGVIRRPTLALMGERGAEAVLPLVRDSLGRLGVGAQITINLNNTINTSASSFDPISQGVIDKLVYAIEAKLG